MTPWTVAHQAPLAVEFSRQEHWSGLPCPPSGGLSDPGIKPWSPALQADSLPSELQGKPITFVRGRYSHHHPPHLWLRYVCDILTVAPHFIAFLCIALHGYCVFLQTESLWQPCVEQAYRLHFSNSICSLRVCVTSWEFLQYFRLLLVLYLLWWSVISHLWCNCCKKIISRWMLRWWLIDFSNILKIKYVLSLDIILSHI